MQKKLATSLIGFILLLLWLQASKYWGYSIIIPLLFLALITRNTYTYAKAKKICLGKCYFDERSLLYYFWTRKVYIFLVSLFVGLILTSSLVLASFEFTFIDIGIIAVDTFLLVVMYSFLEKNQTFNEKVKTPIIKNITASISSLLMVLVFFTIAYYQTPPDYLQTDLQSTLKVIENKSYSKCEEIDFLAYISSIIIATKWWLLAKATLMIDNHYLVKILWVLQLLGNYMMMFAYGRFILELITITVTSETKILKDEENEQRYTK